MKTRSWLGLSALLALAVPAAAQPAAPDDLSAFDKALDALFVKGGLTAEAAAARAGKASPTVRRKVAEVDATIASAEQAEFARVPQIGAKLSYTRLSALDPVNFGGFTIPILLNSYVAEANVVVALSDYVLRYPKLVDAAHYAEDVAKVSKRASELGAGEDARLAYYEWVRARLQVLIADQQLTQIQATLKQVRALADAQRVSKADLLRFESQEAQAEQVVDQLRSLAELREEQLRLLIGATDTEPLAIGEDIRLELAVPATSGKLDDLIAEAKQKRLDFKTLDLGILAKEKQRQSENASLYPRLSAFGTADYANPNQRVFLQADKFTFTWAAGLQLTWTINDKLNAMTTDRRLRAETDEIRADRESLERGTRIEVLAAQQAVMIAQHALATSQKGLVAAQESYRVRQALLAAERATAVELVDAETDLTRARITALNARVDLRVALAQLFHALGNDAK